MFRKRALSVFGLLTALVLAAGTEDTSPSTGGAGSKPSATGARSEPAAPAAPVLEIQNWNWSKTYDWAELEGAVKNIGDKPLKNVTAVASFFDKAGNFITSDETLISYNPILPGQTSPFKVMATWNPAMSKARVEFKELMGGSLPHTEKPKK